MEFPSPSVPLLLAAIHKILPYRIAFTRVYDVSVIDLFAGENDWKINAIFQHKKKCFVAKKEKKTSTKMKILIYEHTSQRWTISDS